MKSNKTTLVLSTFVFGNTHKSQNGFTRKTYIIEISGPIIYFLYGYIYLVEVHCLLPLLSQDLESHFPPGIAA